MEFVYLLMLLSIASAAHLLFKFKIEQSVFLTVCGFFIIMFASGLFINLSAGYYIIVSLSISSLVLIVYKSIKGRIKPFNILTPGTAVFVLAFVIYYFSTQGALLHLWDESTHWGIAAKNMYYNSELWTSGLQTLATPVFNQVMLKTVGYKESALYLSQWVLYLACLILPLSGIKWKKGYLAAIYSMAVIFAVSAIFEDGNLTLYADGILAFFFGAMLLEWFIEEDRGYKRYIWAGAGIFMLAQIKSGSGISLSAMFIIFAMFTDTFINKNTSGKKRTYLNNIKTLIIFASIILVSYYSFSIYENGFTGMFGEGGGMSNELLTSKMFIIFAVIAAIEAALFIIFTINIFKNNLNAKHSKRVNRLLIVFSSLTFISILGVLFYTTILRPDFDVRTTVLNFFTAFDKTKMLKIKVMYLIAIIVGIYIINTILAKKGTIKEYINFYAAVVFFSGLYIVGVLYAYLSSFSLGEAVNTASFDRYVGTAIMFAIMFIFMPLLKNTDNPFKKMIAPYLALICCTAFLATKYIPAYETTQSTSEYAATFRQTEISAREIAEKYVSEGDKVFLVIQEDQGFVFNWMRYEFSPIKTNGGYWSFGEGGGWDFAWSANDMKEFLNKANYDYLYLQTTNDYFNEQFAALFGENIPEKKTLYKFTYENETVLQPLE